MEPIKKDPEGELHSNGPVLQGDGALGADPLFNARTQRPRARLIHPLIRHATSSLPSVVHVDTCTKPKLGDVLPQVLGRQASEQEVLEKELSFPRETGHYRPRAERKKKIAHLRIRNARDQNVHLSHGEDAFEAAYDEMLDRQGLSFMDRKCIGGNNAQLQHNRLTTNRQILLPCSNVHVVHVRHHLRFGQRSLLVWGRMTYMCGYQQEEGITSGGST